MSLATEIRADLETLIERYQVCWDVFPHEEMWNGVRLQTGFDLELYGTHESGTQHPSPGCPHCLRVYDALQAIALNTVPEERRSSRYELSPFDQSIRYSHMRHDRPDVLLTITIAHRGPGLDPVDECEVRCLDEIKSKLREVGACQRRWNFRRHGVSAKEGPKAREQQPRSPGRRF